LPHAVAIFYTNSGPFSSEKRRGNITASIDFPVPEPFLPFPGIMGSLFLSLPDCGKIRKKETKLHRKRKAIPEHEKGM